LRSYITNATSSAPARRTFGRYLRYRSRNGSTVRRRFGAGNGDIASLLSYDDRLGVLTPNATTPYYLIFVDLSAGPFVIDMPPNVRGAISDAWQHALPDTNRSAKYLLVGPGQETPTDVAGFEVRRSPTFNVNVGVRITVTDPKEADALLAQLRAYPYAQRANPPAPKIVAPQGKKWSAMPPRGIDYWQCLDEVIQREPIDERDRFFHAMLKPLGIEKGKQFKPDARQTKILTEAALVGEAMARANTFERPFTGVMYRPGSHWHYALALDADYPDAFWDLLDERAAWFYEAVGTERRLFPCCRGGHPWRPSSRSLESREGSSNRRRLNRVVTSPQFCTNDQAGNLSHRA
jgi:hypothetical protein